MNDYLFNQNILIVLSALSAGLCMLFFRQAVRRMNLKKVLIGTGVATAAFAVVLFLFYRTYGFIDTPAGAYYIAFFSFVILALALLQLPKRRATTYGVAAFVSVLLLLGTSINDYYQYYPTVSSLWSGQIPNSTTPTKVAKPHGYIYASLENNLYGNGFSNGKIISVHIPGTQSGLHARNAYVYFPPAYYDNAFALTKFPVLVLLTGTPGTPSSWLQGGHFLYTMNRFASTHEGITPIVVMADHSGSFSNDTECLNSSHGNADTYISVDVPAFLHSHYRVADSAANWGIGGFSEGGMCAAMLALEHPDTYQHFVDIAGDPSPYLNNQSQTLPILFHNSKSDLRHHDINWLLQHFSSVPGFTAQFAIGGSDNGHRIAAMKYAYHLALQRKITSSFITIPYQGHTFNAWFRSYSEYLPSISYYLGATTCGATCTQTS
ncbi:MAG TPA: alpha/beta hydrolase-fold protein [Candidatus Saccharimonadales bacterium]|nr:alpha/beta hydrolase-fold protein [Candidatus Saccharimonadales bacterium]